MLELIPLLSPLLVSPRHLAPIAEVVEASLHAPQRAVVSTPPQHGKTQLISHGYVRLMLANPRLRHGYVTYEAERAEAVSQGVQRMAAAAGLQVEGTRHRWQIPGGGSLIATGIGGPLTGDPIDGLLVIDDPYKNRVEAESAARRRQISEWFRDVALNRMHPGASCLVVQTRWTTGDLAGERTAMGWRSVNLPAIAEANDPLHRPIGAALWPEQRPLSFLEAQKVEVGEYTWASMWQGHPRPRGGNVFRVDPQTFAALPVPATRRPLPTAIGVDLAYTRKTYADHSAAVVLSAHGTNRYVVEVVSMQVEAEAFGAHLAELRGRYPYAPMRFYCSGTEKGSAGLLNTLYPGLHLEALPVADDKFLRAQPVAAAWNAGRVFVPQDAPWLNRFLGVVLNFTGVGDLEDDEVDALAPAFDALMVATDVKAATSAPRTWAQTGADL
ncbi:MAG: hypothetical protein MUF10_20505 [Thermoanaerobaculaceae bacterium]|nr:hypothetical protein [Thermoanaerobaculaceae bacterium]